MCRTNVLGTTSSSLDHTFKTYRPLAPNNLLETPLRRIMLDTYAFQIIISVRSQ